MVYVILLPLLTILPFKHYNATNNILSCLYLSQQESTLDPTTPRWWKCMLETGAAGPSPHTTTVCCITPHNRPLILRRTRLSASCSIISERTNRGSGSLRCEELQRIVQERRRWRDRLSVPIRGCHHLTDANRCSGLSKKYDHKRYKRRKLNQSAVSLY